jgi:hypothetical protein
MAQKIHVELVDDWDGTPADETVRFALDGAEYETDLTAARAKKLRETVTRYADKGRRRPAGKRRDAAHRRRTEDVRAWAKQKGLPISERGRIPADITARYEAAHR